MARLKKLKGSKLSTIRVRAKTKRESAD